MATGSQRAAGRVAVVSGGRQGIGRAFAVRLAREGATVVVADVVPADDTVNLIVNEGYRAHGIQCDVTAPAAVAELAARTRVEFGPVDILVNNAGIYPVQHFLEVTYEDWRRVLSLNLDAPFLMAKAFVPEMMQRGWGRVVNVSSSAATFTAFNNTHYIASKAGIEGFTRALAADVGNRGVTVNAIVPGLTKTETTMAGDHADAFDYFAGMQAIARPGLPEDLANALAFLVSEDASFVTGHALFVNGGMIKVGVEPRSH